MRSTFGSVMIAGLFLFFTNPAYGEEKVIVISARQRPDAIVIGRTATEPEEFAARELAAYLEKITGVDLPIALDNEVIDENFLIAVGKSDLTTGYDIDSLGVEEYILEAQPDRLVIVGGRLPPLELDPAQVNWYPPDGGALQRNRGTLYGVYDFLHSLGVRWYRPEAWGEHVPVLEEITVPAGQTRYAPPFRVRCGMGYYGDMAGSPGRDTEAYFEGTLWAVRNRLNARRRGPSFLGGNLEVIGGGHAYRHLVPVTRYFASNPEYFALINGHRSDAAPHQLCLSNPDVQQLVAAKIIARARANPHLEHLSLAPNDGDGHCQCDGCTAWDDPELLEVYGTVSNSNRAFRFANIIAAMVDEELKAIGTGQRIFMYAYRDHMEAPTLLDEIHPNISVMMTAYTGNSDYSRRLHDPSPPPGYTENQRGNGRFLKHLNRWLELVPAEHFSIYEYWAGYNWIGPLPILRTTIIDRIKAYHRKGLEGIYNMAEGFTHWGPQGLNMYMYTQLMWNPEMDIEAEIDLYYRNYYGPAARVMELYHERLERRLDYSEIWITSGGQQTIRVYTPELLADLDALIAEAKSLVAGDPLYEQRLDGVAKGHEFAVRRLELDKLYQSGEIEKAEKAKAELVEFLRNNAGTVFAGPSLDRIEQRFLGPN